MAQVISFGKATENLTYIPRESVYAVIFRVQDNLDEVATVSRREGRHMLPGGGIEPGEDHRACLRRELIEETGYEIHICGYIGQAEQNYVTLEGEPRRSIGHFYVAEMLEKAHEVREDLNFSWVNAAQSETLLFLEYQAWAVNSAIRAIRKSEQKVLDPKFE